MTYKRQTNFKHDYNSEASDNQEEQQVTPNLSRNNTEPVTIVSEISTTAKKPGWEIARNASMSELSKQVSKLQNKQGMTSDLTDIPSPTKRHSLDEVFNISTYSQPFQIPRMPTENEATEVTVGYRLVCSMCDHPCIENYLRCRVCIKAYHSQCLFTRGHLDDPTFCLPRLAKHDWSCPQCSDITRLLSEDELNNLIQAFELIDRDKDGFIVLEEFLSLQSNRMIPTDFYMFKQYNDSLAKKFFSLMDVTQQGVVVWWDFVLFYSCKLIAAKSKIELATKLTLKELVFAKNLFFKDPRKTFDNQLNIIITQKHFKQVYHDLILTLEKKYGFAFVDTVLGYEADAEQTAELSLMNWNEYLSEISVLILLNRSNDNDIHRPRRAPIPPHLSKASVVSLSKLFTDEPYSLTKLTSSKLDAPITTVLADRTFEESFRKYEKKLGTLNERDQKDAWNKKQMGLSTYTILENSDQDKCINLPQLKPNARDDRRTITDPWTSVKSLQLLRNTPIPIKKTKY